MGKGEATYRPDIDGLRGIAVLAVIWFHSGLPGMSGGFAGVDVFFVISGYLITGIIHREVRAGGFSLGHFYERRIRRIAPALLLVTATTLAVALCLLLPFELEQLAQSAIANLAMASNIYFWGSGDYFALVGAIVPLLHTWSLGAEEQFYLLFPATLLLGERFKAPRATIAGLGLGSFVLCAIATYEWPVAAFYLLPARGWELMLGAAFAVGLLKVPDRLKPAASLTGIALIAAAVVTITEADSFPGWLALLPTIGTALVIGGGPNGPASRALSLRPLVYVGKVSYSFYLWHWPVFVFLRHFRAELELPPALSAAGILFAFLLSVLSYRWIERPARDPRTVFRAVWLPALAAAVIILALSALVIAGKGLPQRLPPRVVGIAAEREAFAPLARACTDVTFDHATTHCHLGPRGEPRFLLLGDSRAAAISEAVESAIAKPGIVISNGSCAPTLGWVSPALKGRERSDCISTNERALAWSASNPDVDIVVLDALWPDYAQEGGTAFWSSAQQVVDRLNAGGKRVFVIAGEPSAAVDVPWASAIREQFGRKPLILNCPKGDVHLTGVTVIDVSAAFCHGVPYRLLTDSSHPSRYAGLTIITPALRGAMAQRH